MDNDKPNIITVYVAALPESCGRRPLYPRERECEVASTGNPVLRHERRSVWRLLEYAVKSNTGMGMEDLNFELHGSRWSCNEIAFSLSHGGGAIAVAVATRPVGVDIEEISGERQEGLARRFFTERELSEYLASAEESRDEAFLHIWTAKEAVFKSREEEKFVPAKIDTADHDVYTRTVSLGGRDYAVSAFSEGASKTELIILRDDGWL